MGRPEEARKEKIVVATNIALMNPIVVSPNGGPSCLFVL
jgi:hypothetical protein